jgi:hypothetical protein
MATVTKKPATKRIRIKLGDIFAVPLGDGSFGVAQIGAIGARVPTYVVLASRFREVGEIGRDLEAALRKPVAAIFVSGSISAVDGLWPRVACRPPRFDVPIPVFTIEAGVSSYSDGIIESIAATYTGARRIMNLEYLRKFLLPGVSLPSAAVDAVPQPPAPSPGAASSGGVPVPPRGRAHAHIAMTYTGEGLPPVDVVRRRQALGHAIENERLGEVTDAGGGGGIVEMELEVEDAAAVHDRLLELAREHGFPEAVIVYEGEEPN